jgi:hypothetical protein
MKGYNLERCIVRLIKQAVDGRGWSQREFASRAMPERTRSAACSAWQSTYAYSQKTGSPTRLKFGDLVDYMDILGIDLYQLIFKARDMVERGWDYRKEDATPVNSRRGEIGEGEATNTDPGAQKQD